MVKLLSAVTLLLVIAHLTVYHFRLDSLPVSVEWSSGSDGPNPRRMSIGVDEDLLQTYLSMNPLIDSLLYKEYGLKSGWITDEPVQFENLNYIRKTVQIPKNFAFTLFNIDLKNLLETYQWEILNVREQMKSGDVHMDIGRNNVIYQRIDFMINKRVQPHGKEFSIIVSGFGLKYDDLTKKFIELPETITLVVPQGQGFSKIIEHEAVKFGKQVITRVPESPVVFYLEDSPDPRIVKQSLYSVLENAPNRAVLVCYEKESTYDVMSNELSDLVKRGYRLREYKSRY